MRRFFHGLLCFIRVNLTFADDRWLQFIIYYYFFLKFTFLYCEKENNSLVRNRNVKKCKIKCMAWKPIPKQNQNIKFMQFLLHFSYSFTIIFLAILIFSLLL